MHPRPTHGLALQRKYAAKAARALSTWLSAWTITALCLVGAVARASEPWRISVIFHVAQRGDEAVAPAAFIAEQLAAANAIYVPLGIELVDVERVPLAAERAGSGGAPHRQSVSDAPPSLDRIEADVSPLSSQSPML
jgi:hypothetical protein